MWTYELCSYGGEQLDRQRVPQPVKYYSFQLFIRLITRGMTLANFYVRNNTCNLYSVELGSFHGASYNRYDVYRPGGSRVDSVKQQQISLNREKKALECR